MDPLLGISANTPLTPLISIGSNGAVTPSFGLLASELSLSTPTLFGSSSTVVELSGAGQLLSAAATFQEQIQALQPGSATSGGGQNFGTDFASLAAETQSFVDAFNNLQSDISNINVTGNLFGGGATIASGLTQSFNAQVQANYSNANSALSNLSQLGIEFQPSPLPGGGGSLSINLSTLQSAFNSDAAGAFSLLSKAASAFGDVAGSYVAQANSQYSALAALAQFSSGVGSFSSLISNSLLSQGQSGNFNIANLLSSGSLTGNPNVQQMLIAMNEYAMVSGLLA